MYTLKIQNRKHSEQELCAKFPKHHLILFINFPCWKMLSSSGRAMIQIPRISRFERRTCFNNSLKLRQLVTARAYKSEVGSKIYRRAARVIFSSHAKLIPAVVRNKINRPTADPFCEGPSL